MQRWRGVCCEGPAATQSRAARLTYLGPARQIPYQPRAAKKRTENLENWLELDPAVKCFTPGIPRAT